MTSQGVTHRPVVVNHDPGSTHYQVIRRMYCSAIHLPTTGRDSRPVVDIFSCRLTIRPQYDHWSRSLGICKVILHCPLITYTTNGREIRPQVETKSCRSLTHNDWTLYSLITRPMVAQHDQWSCTRPVVVYTTSGHVKHVLS